MHRCNTRWEPINIAGVINFAVSTGYYSNMPLVYSFYEAGVFISVRLLGNREMPSGNSSRHGSKMQKWSDLYKTKSYSLNYINLTKVNFVNIRFVCMVPIRTDIDKILFAKLTIEKENKPLLI